MLRRQLALYMERGAKPRRIDPGQSGPSWLTFSAQTKDSFWSVDLFRCESILLRSH